MILRVCAALLLSGAGVALAAEPLDYNRDVRPILSEYCFKCHGFDDKTRDGGRRLDTRDGALALTDGIRAIVPKNLAESDLHVRIRSTEKDEAMPPPKTGKKLSEEQKAVLDRWIEEGAPYAKHWAFAPVRQPPIPDVAGAANPIDAFIRARLAREGLEPSPEAEPYTLCRRLYLDLIGLPPSPEEADRFAAAVAATSSEKAVAELADRLLASPSYGERWARRWLDLARYADSNGYEKDRPRSMWPWRDWVVKALNDDMPFDEFTIEQLAGDLLPQPTSAQIVATGFHRNTMLNEEGGIDPQEYRFHSLTDRVGTTGTVWLGLTVGCAQCHTHKYDPLLHREYYQLMAFFNNADEPTWTVKPPDWSSREQVIETAIARVMSALPERFPVPEGVESPSAAADAAFAKWLVAERATAVRWTPLRPAQATANLPYLTVRDDLSIMAEGDQSKSDTYELTFRELPADVTTIRLEALPDESLPQGGPGRVFYEGKPGDFMLSNIAATADGQPAKFASASQSFCAGKFDAAAAIDDNLQTGWSIDGGQGQAHSAVFRFAQPLGTASELRLSLLFARHFAAGLGHFRISVTTDPRPLPARNTPPEIEALLLAGEDLTADQRARLFHHFLLVTPELAAVRAEIATLRSEMLKNPTTLVLRERPAEHARQTFVHLRGEYLQTAELVSPGVPGVLPPLPPGAKADRLALARWLVSPENPLTARVTVNRQWAILFGRGLVKTTEDFGLQGTLPTHPELLDWLAGEFVREGWSLKKLHRLIVTSATYRQSSTVRPELAARDPDNRWLARGPRGRLEAELLRDSALKAAGLLSLKMGGPSVYPPQAAGVSEVAYGAPKWKASTGEDRYRRALYTFAKRTAPYAMGTTFDAPTGESCLARREISNSPLQALTLLNDVVFVEAAQTLGAEMAGGADPAPDRLRTLFRRILTRPPTAKEAARLDAFREQQRTHFDGEAEAARAVCGPKGDASAEQAAWTVLARALLNLDEAITRS